MLFNKTIGDSWKILQGHTMQHKQDASGQSIITFTKVVDNVILGIDLKANDDGTTELSKEYVYEIIEEDQPMKTEKLIHRTSIILALAMVFLAYGTVGSLELDNIDFNLAVRRLLIFALLFIFGSVTAYLTRKEDKH